MNDERKLSERQAFDCMVIGGISLIIGLIYPYIKQPIQRCLYGGSVGLFVVVIFCKMQSIFIFLSMGITLVWTCFPASQKRQLLLPAFIAIIGVRVLYQFSDYIIGIETNNLSSANLIHMLITLRCVSLIYDLHDSKSKTETRLSRIYPRKISNEPTLTEMACYLTFIPGIIFGPFYTYETFHNNVQMPVKTMLTIPRYKQAITKLAYGFVLLTILEVLEFCDILMDDIPRFKQSNIQTIMMYIFIKNIMISCMFNSGFRFGEAICGIYGLGAFKAQANPGQGPPRVDKEHVVETEWNFNTVYNGSGEFWFLKTSISGIMLNWNKTTQWWLLRYVHTNDAIRQYPRFLRYIITQFINAIWHGCDIGYFVCFIGTAVCDGIERIYRKRIKSLQQHSNLLNFLGRLVFPLTMQPFVNLGVMYTDYDKVVAIYGTLLKPICVILLSLFVFVYALSLQLKPKTDSDDKIK